MLSPVAARKAGPPAVPGAVAWLVAGAGLLALTAVGVAQDLGPLTLALVLAGLSGVLVLLRPALGVIALTSTFFLSYPAVLAGSGWLTINNALGLLLAGALIVTVAVERRVPPLESQEVRLFLAVAFALVLNQLLAESAPAVAELARGDLTAQRFHGLVTKLGFLVFLVTFIRTRGELLLLVGCVLGFVLLTAPGAVWNALTAAGDVEQVRASADFGIVAARNANRLAFVSALGIAFIGYGLPEARSRLARALGLLAIALLVVTVVLSASRSGLLNLGVLVLILLVGPRLSRRARARLALGLLLLVVVALLAVPDTYRERITAFALSEGGEGAEASVQKRLGLVAVAARMFLDHPLLGVGLGNFRWVSVADYGHHGLSALHNSYLLVLVEGGLLLLVPYLLLFVVTMRNLGTTRRLAAARPGLRLGWLVEGTRAGLILFLVFSLFADVWHEVFLYLLIGFAVVLGRLHREAGGGTAG